MQFKRFETKAEQTDSKITFVASTANPDRYGDVVDQKGWNLKAYERNPVVLLNHNPNQLPIGKGRAYVKNGQLMLDVEFDKNDEMAQRVEQKVKGGFINAVSVGFQPSESIARNRLPSDHPYHGKSGYYFQKSELLEVSIVTIPANNEATLSKNFNLGFDSIVKNILSGLQIFSVQKNNKGGYTVEFVPTETSSIKRGIVGSMINDGIEMPLYSTKEEAEEKAEEMGGQGFHEHTLDGDTVYMPFESHEQIMEIMSDKDDEERDMIEDEEEKYRYDDEEESKEEREFEKDEEDEEKSFYLNQFLRELQSINKQ